MFYRLHSAVDVQKVESFKDLLTMEKEIVLGASISQLEEIEKPTPLVSRFDGGNPIVASCVGLCDPGPNGGQPGSSRGPRLRLCRDLRCKRGTRTHPAVWRGGAACHGGWMGNLRDA